MILQIVFSFCLSASIFFLAFHLEVSEIGWSSNLNALMIVLGGTLSATLIAYPWKKLIWVVQLLKKTFISRNEKINETIETIVHLTRVYRQTGIRALEKEGEKLPPGTLRTAVELMAYHCSREKMELAILKEAQLVCGQYETAHKILHNMARLAPALGLTGTIVNLIRIFGNIQDAKSLVGYMAIALLSTFYGVVLANFCFIPLSNKIKEYMAFEETRLELIQEGVLDLYDKENPLAIQFKLESLSKPLEEPDIQIPRLRLRLVSPRKRAHSVIS